MPKQFYIRVTHGITGGFAPATPTSVQQITSSLSGSAATIQLQTTTRAKDQAKLPDAPTAESVLPSSSHNKVDELVTELEEIFKKLPREDPPGSKDIYGMDVGIVFGSDAVQWQNGGPAGCGEGFSQTDATDADKKEFTRALEIIDKLTSLGQVETA
ncbi:hypothetical protein M408DRAFT_332477 [Serendipita vermifera MAFF 305830]|uniref:Uncharacterized protein n=1 Tax=Serendipita vermifera MAFF 305830 TaxID=933852 RepID=A0A0C3AT39_SERVB|nr:hypothetical protein M408DRAFT_332477 [Serendipita vermifera MAFF 305830]